MKDFEANSIEYIRYHLEKKGYHITDDELHNWYFKFNKEQEEEYEECLTDYAHNFVNAENLPDFTEHCPGCIGFQRSGKEGCKHNSYPTLGCNKLTEKDVVEELRDEERERIIDEKQK